MASQLTSPILQSSFIFESSSIFEKAVNSEIQYRRGTDDRYLISAYLADKYLYRLDKTP
ncbi:hypothetical protein AB4455_23180 [Vibrio sp. 10N.261.46.E12]|uniref:hypothetical protein n=1 Tax=unclassified Vibrio TaxID=2614977 RepID=UPI0012FFDC85|nr:MULTISPECIES: hypothetical protein [unclassified Vibrio]